MTAQTLPRIRTAGRSRSRRRTGAGPWLRFALMVLITAVLLAPLTVVVLRAFTGFDGGFSLQGLAFALSSPRTAVWFGNSLLVTAATVVVTTLVAAPAGYVLSRVRGRAVGGYAITVFGLQSLPAILFVTPMFIVFADLGLVDNLVGLAIVYIGLSTAVATWTMSSAFDAIPVALEEAAQLDGCSTAGAYWRVVLPNAAPGLLSTAVVTFLFAWNDYWMALIFIVSDGNDTVGLALAGAGRSPALALLALLPPLVVFVILNRRFRFGGVGGSLVG